jgi:hypothetical protein
MKSFDPNSYLDWFDRILYWRNHGARYRMQADYLMALDGYCSINRMGEVCDPTSQYKIFSKAWEETNYCMHPISKDLYSSHYFEVVKEIN